MSLELNLLKLFCEDRVAEAGHYAYLSTLENMEREVLLLFKLVHAYYGEYPDANKIERDELISYYDLKHPRARDRELQVELIKQAFMGKVTGDLMKAHLDQLLEQHYATKLVNKLLPVMEGDKFDLLHTVSDDISMFTDLLHTPPPELIVPVPNTKTTMQLVEEYEREPGLDWPVPRFTDIIGPLRRKTIGLIYAYTDTGKTSFVMRSVADFAEQLIDTDECIVYAGNEEDSDRLRNRLIQAFTKWTRRQVFQNPEGADKLAMERGLDKIWLYDGINTSSQLEYVIKQHSPYAIIIDQTTNIELKGHKSLEGVAKLETLFRWYRQLANRTNVGIIGVAQAIGEAEDTKYLKLGDIYGARVAIQAALDWGCGIGRKIKDAVDGDMRYFNFPKNKLHDGESDKFACMFNRYTCEWDEV
jgi:hypothetical protein